jgi:hypothetical protein
MQYVIGFFIPSDINQIKCWKEKLEYEIRKIENIIEKLGLPYFFPNSIEATKAAQMIKEHLGETEVIAEISVEPFSARKRSGSS